MKPGGHKEEKSISTKAKAWKSSLDSFAGGRVHVPANKRTRGKRCFEKSCLRERRLQPCREEMGGGARQDKGGSENRMSRKRQKKQRNLNASTAGL